MNLFSGFLNLKISKQVLSKPCSLRLSGRKEILYGHLLALGGACSYPYFPSEWLPLSSFCLHLMSSCLLQLLYFHIQPLSLIWALIIALTTHFNSQFHKDTTFFSRHTLEFQVNTKFGNKISINYTQYIYKNINKCK